MDILKRFTMNMKIFSSEYSHTSSKSISSVNCPWLDEPLFVLPSLSISSCVANSKTLFPRDWIASNLNSIIGLISSKYFVIFCPTIIGRARRNATPKQLTSSSFCISKMLEDLKFKMWYYYVNLTGIDDSLQSQLTVKRMQKGNISNRIAALTGMDDSLTFASASLAATKTLFSNFMWNEVTTVSNTTSCFSIFISTFVP